MTVTTPILVGAAAAVLTIGGIVVANWVYDTVAAIADEVVERRAKHERLRQRHLRERQQAKRDAEQRYEEEQRKLSAVPENYLQQRFQEDAEISQLNQLLSLPTYRGNNN